MPRISSFFGIVIEMYFGDHPPPHFHARYSGERAARPRSLSRSRLAGSLSKRALRLVREWAEQHRGDLEANWERVVNSDQPESIDPTAMTEMITVTDVEPLEGLRIRATFSDGAIKDIDLSELIGKGSVFAPIRDQREIFEQVRVNSESHTVEWPGEVDLDPDVLYGHFEPASGIRLKRRTIREPIRAAN